MQKKYGEGEPLKPARAKFNAAEAARKECEGRITRLEQNIQDAESAYAGSSRGKRQNEDIQSMKSKLREAQKELPGLEKKEADEKIAKAPYEAEYEKKIENVKTQGKELISKFREIITEFENSEKYPLRVPVQRNGKEKKVDIRY